MLRLQALDHYFSGEQELRLLHKFIKPAQDVIDAGANIGIHSYFLRRYARRVYAYEPNPQLATRLARILPDIVVRKTALSDTPVCLKIPVDGAGNHLHGLASIA